MGRRRISFFKKLKLFKEYKKILKSLESELEFRFNVRIDSAKRIYTVINVPPDFVGEAYSLKKSDIDKISENYIRQYIKELSLFLDSKGLKELYTSYKFDKVQKHAYLYVFGFSLFNSLRYYNTIYYAILPILVILSIVGVIFLNF